MEETGIDKNEKVLEEIRDMRGVLWCMYVCNAIYAIIITLIIK